eukprot:Phypoly_transcript_01561.p1 GENE.Phypoly_transcript_01561~~Phypoly_transcript_01561.p1  ORF type:complete len:816 (+),score=145.17 Phypoly_transcript_01561:105-2552(+)
MKKKAGNRVDMVAELERRVEVLAKCLVDLAEENLELRKQVARKPGHEQDEEEEDYGEGSSSGKGKNEGEGEGADETWTARDVPILSYHAKRHVVTIGKHKLDKDSKTLLKNLNVDDFATEGQVPSGMTLTGVRPVHPLLTDPIGEDSYSSSPSSFVITPSSLASSQQSSVVSDDEEEDDWTSTRVEEEVQPGPGFSLLGGETILLKVHASRVHLDPEIAVVTPGTFYVTNFRLVFVSLSDGPTVEFALTSVSSVEKVGGKRRATDDTGYRLDIQSKYMRPTLRLAFARTKDGDVPRLRRRVYRLLLACGPHQPTKFMFAFSYHGGEANYKPEPNSKGGWGWDLLDARPELMRLMGTDEKEHAWRITSINKDYHISDTYPQHFAVPAKVTDAELKLAAHHRRRGRVPALAWIHPINKASITRCSQPLSGVSRSHSPEDVKLVTSILSATPGASELLIMDARPLVNARANVVMGAGYEHIARYTNCRLDFMGIPNIHVVRDSWLKLKELLCDETKKLDDYRWRTALESTGWHQYVGTVLSASCKLASAVEGGVSVLTHCSDGWDRTSQLVALAILMLDPQYRTLQGFCMLIERQWVDFGHKFAHRHGHAATNRNHQPNLTENSTSEADHSSSEVSPIFVQFLDCTWQITRQFPCSFEFNDSFLQFIADQSYSCRFGTFLANNRREQQTMCLPETTVSIWTYVAMQQEEFTNPLYTPDGPNFLRVAHTQQSINLWPYYTKHVLTLPLHPSHTSSARINELTKKAKAAIDRAQTLEVELASCTKRLMELLTSTPDDPTPSSSTAPGAPQRKKLFGDEIG